MKRMILFAIRVLLSSNICFSVTHTVSNSGTSFSPGTLTINLGDTVNFVLASIHDAREVNQATWNANQNTSNGGFQTPFGGGTVVLQTTGIHYYVCVPHAAVGMKGTITVNQTTGVRTFGPTTPAEFALGQNYPNPFNPATEIRFTIADSRFTTLRVYDMIGKEVAELVNGEMKAGNYSVEWNGANVASGVYFYRLQAGNFIETRRMNLIR